MNFDAPNRLLSQIDVKNEIFRLFDAYDIVRVSDVTYIPSSPSDVYADHNMGNCNYRMLYPERLQITLELMPKIMPDGPEKSKRMSRKLLRRKRKSI